VQKANSSVFETPVYHKFTEERQIHVLSRDCGKVTEVTEVTEGTEGTEEYTSP